ncbi:hypothetical protein THASP1DRAFT_29201 [Thamnocephalis sphaerospora]|uniref:MSP domain-containing protein n=1 Tax=Thamnocephalis sphaerospora TaxID=78915 RepID=A0A4P9XTX0_9FUNG|nr:hypothetical protein THASP1DRAFT_29201 [Thamnocephalis sphaerospora]|eukprot:RKP09011.1 hypothetical protein THASP1DRAFT_29201 [Thamnocephalis sphaerospora]
MSDTSSRRTSGSGIARPMTPPGGAATIRVSPSEFSFQASRSNPSVLVGRVSLRIVAADAPIGFKFKTNAPDRYSVRPVMGVLSPSGETLEIFARCEGATQADDRFMIESVTLTPEEAEHLDSKTWKQIDRRRMVENFIHCRPYAAAPSTATGVSPPSSPPTNWSTVTSARTRMHTSQRHGLTHGRHSSLELHMSRNALSTPGVAIATPQAATGTLSPAPQPASPSLRPLVVGTRPRGSIGGVSMSGSDVETGLTAEKRSSHAHVGTLAGNTVSRPSRRHRGHVDKGLIDLLPQIALLLLACVVITFWLPVHRWIGALLLPWLGRSGAIVGDDTETLVGATDAPMGAHFSHAPLAAGGAHFVVAQA